MTTSIKAHVDIVVLENNTSRLVLRIFWDGTSVTFEGDSSLADRVKKYTKDRKGNAVTPDDGYLFLDAVSKSYNNPYLLATQVIEA